MGWGGKKHTRRWSFCDQVYLFWGQPIECPWVAWLPSHGERVEPEFGSPSVSVTDSKGGQSRGQSPQMFKKKHSPVVIFVTRFTCFEGSPLNVCELPGFPVMGDVGSQSLAVLVSVWLTPGVISYFGWVSSLSKWICWLFDFTFKIFGAISWTFLYQLQCVVLIGEGWRVYFTVKVRVRINFAFWLYFSKLFWRHFISVWY